MPLLVGTCLTVCVWVVALWLLWERQFVVEIGFWIAWPALVKWPLVGVLALAAIAIARRIARGAGSVAGRTLGASAALAIGLLPLLVMVTEIGNLRQSRLRVLLDPIQSAERKQAVIAQCRAEASARAIGDLVAYLSRLMNAHGRDETHWPASERAIGEAAADTIAAILADSQAADAAAELATTTPLPATLHARLVTQATEAGHAARIIETAMPNRELTARTDAVLAAYLAAFRRLPAAKQLEIARSILAARSTEWPAFATGAFDALTADAASADALAGTIDFAGGFATWRRAEVAQFAAATASADSDAFFEFRKKLLLGPDWPAFAARDYAFGDAWTDAAVMGLSAAKSARAQTLLAFALTHPSALHFFKTKAPVRGAETMNALSAAFGESIAADAVPPLLAAWEVSYQPWWPANYAPLPGMILRGADEREMCGTLLAILAAPPEQKFAGEPDAGPLAEWWAAHRDAVRRRAFIFLSEVADERAFDVLVAHVRMADQPDLQRAALNGLGNIGGEKIVEPVVTALEAAWIPEKMLPWAYAALAASRDTERALPLIMRGADQGRESAYLALELMDVPAAIPSLRAAVLLGNPEITDIEGGLPGPWAAFAAIGEPAVPTLFDLLGEPNPEQPEIWMYAAMVLRRIVARTPDRATRAAWLSQTLAWFAVGAPADFTAFQPGIKDLEIGAAVFLLREFGGEAVPAIGEFVYGSNAPLAAKRAAIQALQRIAAPAAMQMLLRACATFDPTTDAALVATAAITALGWRLDQTPDAACAPALVAALNAALAWWNSPRDADADAMADAEARAFELTWALLVAAKAVPTREMVAVAFAIADAMPDPAVRAAAIRLLDVAILDKHFGERQADGHRLVELAKVGVQHALPELVNASARALGRLDGFDTVPVLAAQMRRTDGGWLPAAVALSKLSDRRVVPVIVDYFSHVRTNAWAEFEGERVLPVLYAALQAHTGEPIEFEQEWVAWWHGAGRQQFAAEAAWWERFSVELPPWPE